MMFDLPTPDTLYRALVERDPTYDGRAYVCVTSTGIFCRLTCSARKPKPENCRFQDSVAACLEAGFRPCKRCHPLQPGPAADPSLAPLIEALNTRPGHRFTEGDIVAMGIDPSTARRAFKRQYGLTFLEMARLTRLRMGFETLQDGGKVIDAQLDAGFASPSGFRTAMARLIGVAPGALTGPALLQADWIETPLGQMVVVADASHVHLLEFADRKALPTEMRRLHEFAKGQIGLGRTAPMDSITDELGAFFAGRAATFQTPLALHGSPFTKTVWQALRAIPAGTTTSYGQLAATIARPTASRAVARANGANQIAIAIPCHRVIGADGQLTGYGGGLWRKQRLIEIERQFT